MKYITSKKLALIIFVLFQLTCNSQDIFMHSDWNKLLSNYVSDDGKVNYQVLKENKQELYSYLSSLQKIKPNDSWSREKIMAFWINTYNAFTIKLIIDHYPLTSIMDLKFDSKSAWDHPFIVIDGKEMSLNYIEHEILRKNYFDARIHFAVNCASFSCPRLLNIAYTEDNLEKQLEQMTKEFVNSNLHNTISANEIEISQLFNWYNGDFIKEVSLIDFLNKYSNIFISSSAQINFKEYNWNLNDKN